MSFSGETPGFDVTRHVLWKSNAGSRGDAAGQNVGWFCYFCWQFVKHDYRDKLLHCTGVITTNLLFLSRPSIRNRKLNLEGFHYTVAMKTLLLDTCRHFLGHC